MITVHSRQGEDVRRLLEFAQKIDWSDSDISWLGQAPQSPVKAFEHVLKAMEEGAEKDEMCLPMWDEKCFKAGRLSKEMHLGFWRDVILVGCPDRQLILENLGGMKPSRYFKHFKGRYMGKDYDCASPPPRVFSNNLSTELTSTGETAKDWAVKKVQQDVRTGAIRCLGKVGEVEPPRVVLPLSVELEKPRLITDARYVNLFCDPAPFKLDTVGLVPDTFRRDGMLGDYDHKSGYHHFLFSEEEQGYFGFELDGMYYVFAAGCFGWSKMPEIYHKAHMALLRFAQRVFGIPCLGYLDDCLFGSTFGKAETSKGVEKTARAAGMMLAWINFLAGYSVSEKKSVFEPCWEIIWLGILIDAKANRFFIPEEKKRKLLDLMRGVVTSKSTSIAQLESIAGKCISLQLAVGEAAKLYIRAMFDILTLVRGGKIWTRRSVGKLALFPIHGRGFDALRRSLEVWLRCIELFNGAPWYDTMHKMICIKTDASGRAWGGVLKDANDVTILSVGEEFHPSELGLDIETKEAMAVVRTIKGIVEAKGKEVIRGARLNMFIDYLALVYAIANGASKNKTTQVQVELLFWMKMEYSFATTTIWLDTKANWEADAITRTEKDNDYRLADAAFDELWEEWGPFDMDLAASSVNVQSTPGGGKLPFFSRFSSTGCKGVDVLAQQLGEGRYYCFPPKAILRSVVCHLRSMSLEVVLITPKEEVAWYPFAKGCVLGRRLIHRRDVRRATLQGMEHVEFVATLLKFD
jgi:hypothetical protein